MRKLPLEIIDRGFTYRQLKRSKYCALYSQTRIGFNEPWAWEVIQIHIQKEDKATKWGKFEKGEYYPSSADWGNHGWTYETLAGAEKAYTELCAKPPKKEK